MDYTKGRTVKQLISSLEKTRSDELAKKASWSLEDSKEKKLEDRLRVAPSQHREMGPLIL